MDIGYFRNKLQAQERELLEELETSEQTGSRDTVQLDQQSVGRLSRIDAMQGQQMALEQQRRRQRQLLAIHSALRRIEEEDYGYCIQCGEEINLKRLDVNPCAVKCIHCAK